MSRTLDRIASTLILSLGLMLSFLAPTRGDDGKDATKKKAPAPPAPAATKSEPQKAPAEKARPQSPAPAESPKPKASAPTPVVKPVSFIREVAPILVENCIACHNPAEVGEQVRDDDVRPARQGRTAGGRDHARARQARRESLRRADSPRWRAADALQARPAPAGEDRDHRALGDPGSQIRRRRADGGLDDRASQDAAGSRSRASTR